MEEYYPIRKCTIHRTQSAAVMLSPTGMALFSCHPHTTAEQMQAILLALNDAFASGWIEGRGRMIRQIQALENKNISTEFLQEAS